MLLKKLTHIHKFFKVGLSNIHLNCDYLTIK